MLVVLWISDYLVGYVFTSTTYYNREKLSLQVIMSETDGAVEVAPASVSEAAQPMTKKRRASENGIHALQKNGSVEKEKNVDDSYFA